MNSWNQFGKFLESVQGRTLDKRTNPKTQNTSLQIMSEEGLSLEMQWPSRYGYWCWWPTFWPFDDVLCLHFLWGHNMLVLLLLLRQPLYPMLCPQILKSIVVCWGTRYCEWFLQTLSYPTQDGQFSWLPGKRNCSNLIHGVGMGQSLPLSKIPLAPPGFDVWEIITCSIASRFNAWFALCGAGGRWSAILARRLNPGIRNR